MKDITYKRLMIFGVIAAVFLGILSVFYYYFRSNYILTILMMTPALSVVLTRIITREGTKELYLKPNFKGNLKWYFAAYLLTPFISYVGAVLYFMIFQSDYDPLGSAYAADMGITVLNDYYKILAEQLPLAILINPIMGLVQCFGEEFAWRGYLLLKLSKKLCIWKATLLTGVIWGIWHSPIIFMGFNYGTVHPVFGIFAMILFSTVMGTITAYLFFKTGSVWPAVLFHASVNAIDLFSPSDLFMSGTVNTFIGPDQTGIIGGIGFVIVAAVCFIYIYKNKQTTGGAAV